MICNSAITCLPPGEPAEFPSPFFSPDVGDILEISFSTVSFKSSFPKNTLFCSIRMSVSSSWREIAFFVDSHVFGVLLFFAPFCFPEVFERCGQETPPFSRKTQSRFSKQIFGCSPSRPDSLRVFPPHQIETLFQSTLASTLKKNCCCLILCSRFAFLRLRFALSFFIQTTPLLLPFHSLHPRKSRQV